MPLFSYIAKTNEGQEVRSSLEAGTRLEALESLRKKGLTVIDLFNAEEKARPAAGASTEALKLASPSGKPRRSFSFSSKVKMTDLAVFCRQLAISVNAGVPLRDAIEGIGMELEQPVLKRVSRDMVQQLHDGQSFSEVIRRHPKVFNEMFYGLVKVAEESGKLPETLSQLASYLERADRLQRRIRALAAYPVFIGIFFLVICLIMTLFILPRFTEIFSGLGAELPVFTKIIFSVNTFFVDNFLLILIGVSLLVMSLVFYGRSSSGSYRKDLIKLKAPYAGGCLKKYILARFCRSLAIMVNSGVPISNALEICAHATGNQLLKRNVMGVREMIMTGNRISASLDKAGIFPGLIVRMVAVGEDSGQLPEVLDNVSELYEDQVEVSIMTTMALFEPLIICVFGAFILILVLAIYLPIFTVSMNMR
ncbi:type II secretion system F family protein [Pontiella agarivorans]|uniref:Type II secretion system F family protein n=1 Tax=Pontiella agarivorans TaxID=3038953 RepID=A0ABU5MYN1_9BACT|nr:type II secretion system F family protein [Pontiella agarivorans]MDZ8119279.1 type II secretion system F family protein [Pontiella agarivorans]